MSIDENTPAIVPANNEVTASQPPCCSMRSMLQTPLLLFAAVSVGFSAQQVWTNPEVHRLFSGESQSACGRSVGGHCCSLDSQQAQMAGMVTGASSDSPTCALGAHSGCCGLTSIAAEDEQPVSALSVVSEDVEETGPVSAVAL